MKSSATYLRIPNWQKTDMNKCIVCGKETTNKVFCSQACRSANSKTYKRICKFCKQEFETKVKTQQYCTRECYNTFVRLTRSVQVECHVCGKIFRTIASRANRTKYCSNECRLKRYQHEKKHDLTIMKTQEGDIKTQEGDIDTCATCHYCQLAERPTEDKGCWACADAGSIYYKSLLNIDENGSASKSVSWEGCERWRIERNKGQVKKRIDPAKYKTYELELAKVRKREAEEKAKSLQNASIGARI